MPKKNWKGSPFGVFIINSVAKLQKMKGKPFGGKQTVAQCQKKTENGPFTLAWEYMLPGKRKKTFLVQFPGLTGVILNFVKLLVSLFWSLQVYQKNTDKKP